MKFVVLDNRELPMYNGVKGPIMTPTAFDVQLVLKWLAFEIDVREVMEDGSFRKLEFNDKKLMRELDEKLEMKRIEKEQKIKLVEQKPVTKKAANKKVVVRPQPKKEEVKEPEVKKEPELFVDDLKKPE